MSTFSTGSWISSIFPRIIVTCKIKNCFTYWESFEFKNRVQLTLLESPLFSTMVFACSTIPDMSTPYTWEAPALAANLEDVFTIKCIKNKGHTSSLTLKGFLCRTPHQERFYLWKGACCATSNCDRSEYELHLSAFPSIDKRRWTLLEMVDAFTLFYLVYSKVSIRIKVVIFRSHFLCWKIFNFFQRYVHWSSVCDGVARCLKTFSLCWSLDFLNPGHLNFLPSRLVALRFAEERSCLWIT